MPNSTYSWKSHDLEPSVLYLGMPELFLVKLQKNSTPSPHPRFDRHLFNQLIRSMVKLWLARPVLCLLKRLKNDLRTLFWKGTSACLIWSESKRKNPEVSVKCSEWVYVCLRKCRPGTVVFNSMVCRNF